MSTLTSEQVGPDSSVDDLSEDFIKALCKRIESFLPNITGYSLSEVELNPQFMITKNILINNANSHPNYISSVMFNLCKILNSINKDSNDLRLRDRDEKILSSTLIILKILTALIEKLWKGLVINSSSINSGGYHFNTYNNFEIVNTFTFYYQFDIPPPLNKVNLDYILDTLIELMSNDIIKFALNSIQTHPIDYNKYYHNSNPPLNTNNVMVGQSSNNYMGLNNVNLNPNVASNNFSNISVASDSNALNTSSTGIPLDEHIHMAESSNNSINQTMFSSSTSQSDFEISKLINDIDLYIEVCLRFISTSSSKQYFLYLYDKLFRFNDIADSFTFYGLLKYSPMIKYQFYSEYNGLLMAKSINKTLMNLKNNTWKQIILLFYAQSVRDQALARPEDYNAIVLLGGEVASTCKSIFDQTNNIFDELPYSGVISMVQSWISTLIPSDYRDYESGPNKLKINFNRRLKFINNLIKDSNNKNNLTSFDSLITLFHLAARFPTSMHEHPIYLFSMNYLDITFKNLLECDLSKFSAHLEATSGERIKRSFDNLIVNFYVAAIILKPEKYIDMFINKFRDIKDCFRDVRIVIKILRKLTDLSISVPYYHHIMKKLSADIKVLTFNVAKMLNQCYDLSMGTSSNFATSSSSSVSIHSDRVSISSQRAQRKMSFDKELSPGSIKLLNLHHGQVSQQLLHPYEIDFEKLKFTSPSFVAKTTNTKSMYNLEDLLADLFTVFRYSSFSFFNDISFMNEEVFNADENACRKRISKYVEDNVNVLRIGLQSRSINNNASVLFNCTGDLIMTIVDKNNEIYKNQTNITTFANYMTCKQIIKVICDSCLSLSLRDSKFKSSMVFLNRFLSKRDEFQGVIEGNSIIADPRSHVDEPLVGNSMERVLLLSLCTHDIQFYNITKETMRWHVKQVGIVGLYFPENLQDTFRKITNDESVFTGFVSLHKRFRSILRGAAPTKALYQVWLIIYERWIDLLQNKNSLNEENLLFRHFTGFLVSTSGCFLTEKFAVNDHELKTRLEVYMSTFFDKCIELLTSQDLVVRVIVKDAISNETHSAVYHMVSKKLTAVVTTFEENRSVDEESVLFTEQAIMIITAMISIPNDGSILLTASLPEICITLIQLINMVDDAMNQLRLKLRFCKLVVTIEENRERLLLSGAYRIRNLFAKGICDWLEQSAFHEELPSSTNGNSVQRSSSYTSHSSSLNPKNSVKDSELAYINIDLATESSKALALQLEELILEIPDGTLQQDIPKYKDLAFANYFSLFYKILTKYTSTHATPIKSKYKVQLIVDNVLRCITNLLQYDTDIGLQFVFPLGYHDNKKIRALFLSVFADMLYERKFERNKDADYSPAILSDLKEVVDIVRAASVIASTHNQNLYASAVFGIYGYLKQLDVVFEMLLAEEIQNVSRTSDIFRRNSILTKLLAKLAKDYGLNYLTIVLKDFVLEFTTKEIVFNVEKEEEDNFNPDLFMSYLNRLVDLIVNSVDSMPDSFKYICSQIYKRVCEKVPDSGLVAVGSFIFLRFFCPAIISPESFFGIGVIDHQNKKSLLQLVKVIQNMANKTMSLPKSKGLHSKTDELEEINKKIFGFLEEISKFDSEGKYPFETIEELPIPELRYNHKFFFTYFKEIKQQYLLGELSPNILSKRVSVMKIVDQIMKEVGQPKNLLALHGSDSSSGYKSFDPTGTLSSEYTEFMNKMSAQYAEKVLEVPLIHNAIFYDGTPVVVVNLYALKTVNFDVKLLIFKLFETASQVWDNKFYFIFDFTGFSSELHLLVTYATLLNTYGPSQLFRNCTRIYYFNLPIKDITAFFGIVKPSNVSDKDARAKFYTYSHCDSNDIISSLCLSDETMAITRDKKVEFNNCKVLNSRTHEFFLASVRIGRQFLLICSNEFVPTNHELCATSGFRPVEIFMLSDISRCEVTKHSGSNDEFTIFFNNNQNIIIRSHERLEVLRFLFFATSRLPKALVDDDDKEFHSNDISTQWFGKLFNIVFQSLLCDNEEVRSSASLLLASVSNYFEIGFSIARDHAKSIAYPVNITDFIVSISAHLAKQFPEMTYRFFRAFFDCYEKLPKKHRMDAILYVSPWVSNICDHVYLDDEQIGPDRVAGIIRQLCLISALSEENIAATNDYIWKKLFSESILTPILLDEIVTFVMDNRNDDPEWSFIITIVSPSVELCGETIKRLIGCINEAYDSDSEIASESKLFEIMILVKICSSLFFDSYVYAQLFLADIFFICTLFIDNPSLEFGADLQKLVINTIQSFFNKPDLTQEERDTVDATLKYFSGQRAKMLFGLTREKTSGVSDITQLYNRAGSFETLCDYLNDFISVLGSADDRAGWRSRWSSYAMDVAFASGSLFQVRGILVVGILAKTGISDHTTSKVLKLMSGPAFSSSMEYMTNILMSSARIFKGLSPDSVFPSIIIWPEIYFGMLNYSSLYQASIQCLLNTLVMNMEQGDDYLDKIFKQRKHLAPFIDAVEKAHGFHIDKRNFLCYVFFIFTQGLKLSHIKHTSLECLKQVFKERFLLQRKEFNDEAPPGLQPYLYFIWLSCNEESFQEFIETSGYTPKEYQQISKSKIVKLTIDFLLLDDIYPTLTLYHAAYLYSTPTVESGFKARFLMSLNEVVNRKPEKGKMVFHIIRQELENTLINSNSVDVVSIASDIILKCLRDKTYCMKVQQKKTDDFLKENGLLIMKNYKFRKLQELLAEDESAKERIELDNEKLQEMIYRSASSYVENEKLES